MSGADDRPPLRVLSLFSGIGGLDLGLERAGMQIVAHSEIDEYASRVLAKHWPHVWNLGDVTRVDFRDLESEFGPVDVIAGGFPCQDISIAGRQAGIEKGARSGLWTEFLRAIDEVRPKYAIIENVRGSRFDWADRVACDLDGIGYATHGRATWASDFGADHRRERAFLVAHPQGLLGPAFQWDEPHRVAASGGPAVRSGPAGGWGADQSRVGRTRHGVPNRIHRLRCLSNAVVPQVAEYVGRLVVAHHKAGLPA